jgi:hypothetical protein
MRETFEGMQDRDMDGATSEPCRLRNVESAGLRCGSRLAYRLRAPRGMKCKWVVATGLAIIAAALATACSSGHSVAPGTDAASDQAATHDAAADMHDAQGDGADTRHERADLVTDEPSESADAHDAEGDGADAHQESTDLLTDEPPDGPVACGPLTCDAGQYCFAHTSATDASMDYLCSAPPDSCGSAPTCDCFAATIFDGCQFECHQSSRTFNCANI